jgi:hypothetical protein
MKTQIQTEKTWEDIKQLAWEELKQEKYLVTYRNQPVGVKAAYTPPNYNSDPVNYNQCFLRDFVPVALTFLTKDEKIECQGEAFSSREIVSNFLQALLQVQIKPGQQGSSQLAPGMMPASFEIVSGRDGAEEIQPDFGERAIARVVPVDSCLWWLILLRAYYLACQKAQMIESEKLFQAQQATVHQRIRLIIDLCLVSRFDTVPMLLVPDGSCMIDRRLGVYGYFLEIQVLFYAALKAASELLPTADLYQQRIKKRLRRLKTQLQREYWLDLSRLNRIHQAEGEQYGIGDIPHYEPAEERFLNRYNIYPDSIPYNQLAQWLPEDGGYLVGNLGPSLLDTRFFALGNLMAVITSLTTVEQSEQILNLIEARKDDLLGYMPVKICYPALEGQDWERITGCDPKNKPWSYHNGGNWPVLIWMLTAATMKVGRKEFVMQLRQELTKVGNRLLNAQWPEYYDGSNGRLVGREARHYQTWTIAGFLLAQELLDNPDHLDLVTFD